MQNSSQSSSRFRKSGFSRSIAKVAATAALSGAALVTAKGAVIYSGIQNISLGATGVSETQLVNIDFIGDAEFRLLSFKSYGEKTGFQAESSKVYLESYLNGFVVANGDLNLSQQNNLQILQLGDPFPGALEFDPNYQNYISFGTSGPLFPGSQGYLAFQFNPTGTQELKGWIQIQRDAVSGPSNAVTIVDWAYEDSGAAVAFGAVPEPGAALLGVLGLSGLSLRRRRKPADS